jgi:LysM repeat protein
MNDRPGTLRPFSPRTLGALLLSLTFFAAFAADDPALQAQSLLGSRASLLRQNEEAQEHEFSYLQTGSDVRDFAERGLLVRVPGNSSYLVADVSFPYARPEVKTFLERLSSQYRNACRERLVVTSLTRPADRQPRNASPLSVHPTGMALDLRRSNRPACRAWLEKNLLSLEGDGVVEATKERHPPHYHVTVFPKPYLTYLASRGDSPTVPIIDDAPVSAGEVRAAKTSPSRSSHIAKASKRGSKSSRVVKAKSIAKSKKKYKVGRGDSLWTIAQRHGVSVAAMKRANRIRSTHLKPGQVLAIPSR